MSWAEEDWTVGLSGWVQQKVKELQVHQERLSRENKQKQLQLDNIHTSLEKQTAKVQAGGHVESHIQVFNSIQHHHQLVFSSQILKYVLLFLLLLLFPVQYEEVRGELQYLQKELRGVREEAKTAVTSSERLTQELQTKQAQVCSLEGQVDAARTLNNKLALEIKRLGPVN